MNHHLLSQFFNVDEDQLLAAAAAESFAASGHHQIWPAAAHPVYVKTEDSGDDASSNASSWGFTATSPMDFDDAPATINCIPGGLAQISMPDSSRSPSPDMTMTLPGGFNFAAPQQQQQTPVQPVSAIPAHLRPREASFNASSLVSPPVVPTPLTASPSKSNNSRKLNPTSSPTESPAQEHLSLPGGQPHPYSISASNTTALFTRASSVSSNVSGTAKKGRAPPSGPISTKDFVPPDVSGLNKREARLVKNRAAAFLSRQRKREEFEGLEARVEVLEADNARLYKELEGYRSGGSASAPAVSPSGATPAALQAELVGLRRQLAARDQELSKIHGRMQALNADANAERERSAEKDAEIAQLKRQLAAASKAQPQVQAKDEDSDSDSEDAQSVVDGGKKDLKSAGSMAFMVLLFSLSSLLTSAESSSAKPPAASQRVRRPGMHHRDSSRTYLDLPPSQAFSSGLSYDSFLSTSDASMMLSPSFGFDEDNLLGGSSAFAGLTTGAPSAPVQKKAKEENSNVADSLASAISSVKSISPEEFEFDFTVPSSSGSSSSLDSFAFPARPKQQAGGKKIRVCVKSALPLNLNLDALSRAASSSSPSTQTASQQTTAPSADELFTSSFGYRVPDTDDFLADTGLWSTASSAAPTVFGSPTSVLSPTMSIASASTSAESRKRKRVVVEINPRGASRRRVSEEGDDEVWDVKFSEDHELVAGAFDEDVQMRL